MTGGNLRWTSDSTSRYSGRKYIRNDTGNEHMDRGAMLGLGAKYGVLYAGGTVLAVFLGSRAVGYSFGLAALGMVLDALVVLPLLFGASDAGLDTVEEGGVAGFRDVTDPSQYQPDSLSLPGRLELGVYVLGVAAYSAVGLAIVM